MRPAVNWRSAPAYKLSKLFMQKINTIAALLKAFNKPPPPQKKNTKTWSRIYKTPQSPHISPLHPQTSSTYTQILEHPSKRNQDNSCEHIETQHDRPPDATQTFKMVWCHYQAALLYQQPGHSNPTRRPRNGRPFIWHHCRDLPTAHRTLRKSRTDTIPKVYRPPQ